MKVGVMQPYLFPYIGYFQLIHMVDVFVIYDNIKYTKKGWINRNRILLNGSDSYFTLPLKKSSDYEFVINKELSESSENDIKKIINKIDSLYRKAPQFELIFPLIKSTFLNNEKNLFRYIKFTLQSVLNYLEIDTRVVISSEIEIDYNLTSQDKVIALCEKLNASEYINPIGGVNLYSVDDFKKKGIKLSFIKSQPIEYLQFQEEFVPWLSIIDVMMFNSKEKIQSYLEAYSVQQTKDMNNEF